MRNLLKIMIRYSVIAGFILIIILVSNFGIIGYLGYQSIKEQDEREYVEDARVAMEAVSKDIWEGEENYQLSEEGKQILEDTSFIWAMALNQEGKVVWEWQLPNELPRQYSLNDVATFSRWYLCNYPVRVWKQKDLLMVYGYSKDSFVVMHSFYSANIVKKIPQYIKVVLIGNVTVFFFFLCFFGYHFYKALKPISQGIEALSKKEPIRLRERGVVSELAKKINMTSKMLEEQERKLTLRDQARTDWIAGVSHDIRTPLTLIRGYSERLSYSEHFGRQEREMAKSIERQSVIIRQLIEDLNLTSKLTYNNTPLSCSQQSPAQILRECVTDIYNSGLDEAYEIRVYVSEEAEKAVVLLDEKLLKRAIRNILGNSIRHNKEGCLIKVKLSVEEEYLRYSFQDSGPGIPEEIVRELREEENREGQKRKRQAKKEYELEREYQKPHIMGLRLVKQISSLHGGNLKFCQRRHGTYDSEIWIAL